MGVFSIGVITGAYFIISHDMSASYAAGYPANIEVRGESFNEDQVTMVKDMSAIKEAEGRRVTSTQFRVPGMVRWTNLNLIAIKDYKKSRINQLTLIEGTNQPNKKEILLERKAASDLGVTWVTLWKSCSTTGR